MCILDNIDRYYRLRSNQGITMPTKESFLDSVRWSYYLFIAFVCGELATLFSIIIGMIFFAIVVLAGLNQIPLSTEEALELYSFAVYLVVVSGFIFIATNKHHPKQWPVPLFWFLVFGSVFWGIHDWLPRGLWIPAFLGLVATIPIYQIIVDRLPSREGEQPNSTRP